MPFPSAFSCPFGKLRAAPSTVEGQGREIAFGLTLIGIRLTGTAELVAAAAGGLAPRGREAFEQADIAV